MGKTGFVHLHVHSYFSLLAGLASPEALVARAAALGQRALALTDTNNMFGAVRFFRAARRAGVKPIVGLQLQLEGRDPVVLLAENKDGYANLLKLSTFVRSEPLSPRIAARDRGSNAATAPAPPRSGRKGASGSPYGGGGTVDLETLLQHGEGLIVLLGTAEPDGAALEAKARTGDRTGDLALRSRDGAGGPAGAGDRAGDELPAGLRGTVAALLERFHENNVFIQLQSQALAGQEETNRTLSAFARKIGIGVVAANDVRYIDEKDARAHAALLALGARTTLDDPRRPSMGSARFYLASEQDMRDRLHEFPEAVEAAAAIAARCDVRLDTGSLRLPVYRGSRPQSQEDPAKDRAEAEHPLAADGPEQLLTERARLGAAIKFAAHASELPEAVESRLQHELDIICGRGLASYFLIVADIVDEAKRRGIRVGPGRGSAASSFVAYCLGITDVDPLAHGLVFERFLNPERVGMPDIDIDVEDVRRDELLHYIRRRFGEDRVAQIVTFGTLAARAAVREAGRVLGRGGEAADRIARLIPAEPGVTLDRALAESPELQRLLASDRNAARVFALAKAVEGVPRHVSVHAAGVVIGDGPLIEDMPVMHTAEDVRLTQFPMDDVEALGFLKMDVLGLRTLTVIGEARRYVRDAGDSSDAGDLSSEVLDVEDAEVFDAVNRLGTDGLFQLETPMFRNLVRRLQPERFEDIVALLALGRPGPMQRVEQFIRRRRGQAPVRYAHPALEPVLRETFGIIVYQEQVMHIAMHVAGYSAAEADLLRRRLTDVGGGGGTLTPEEKDRFVQGAEEKGLSRAEAEAVLGELVQLAGYGFNKSHSVAYGLLTFETAWLRTRHPAAFLAALLNSHKNNPDRVRRYVAAAKGWGVSVVGPDVNVSGVEFQPLRHPAGETGDPAVVYGLAGVRHVGRGGAEAIVQARREGPFRSFDDLRRRLPSLHANARLLEALVRAGACDGLGESRERMLVLASERSFQPRQMSLSDTMKSPSRTTVSASDGDLDTKTSASPTRPSSRRLLVLRLKGGPSELPALQRLLASHKGDVPVTLELPGPDGGIVRIEVDREFWVDDGPVLRARLQSWERAGKLTSLRSEP